MSNQFSENGFIIVRNAFSKKTVAEVQRAVIDSIYSKKKVVAGTQDKFLLFSRAVNKLKISEYNFVKPIFKYLFYKGLLEKILLEKKLFNSLKNLLGEDLSFAHDVSLTLNLKKKTSNEENYLFKDWHQEIWSGASISSVQTWTPLFQKNRHEGQIELIPKSHRWGHIPHKNRVPVELPKNYKIEKLNIKYGDVILFSTLLVHRTMKTRFPRLALALLLKNFKYKNSSFEENRNWKIFSFSELTKVERYLGNHHLSPFRLLDIDNEINSGTLGK
jgi:hypothetical protein